MLPTYDAIGNKLRNTRTDGSWDYISGIIAIRVGENVRIPDRLTQYTLEEVKNVQYQSLTRQLKDFYQYSQQNGLDMMLHTRSTTIFSKPLQQLIDNGSIIQKTIPGLKRKKMESEFEARYLELLRKPIKSKEEVQEKERLRIFLTEELKLEIKDLSQELAKIGCKYTDPWDLANTKESYPEAIDTLIKHVSKPYHDRNKEGIIRALIVKEAKGKANVALIAEYGRIAREKHNHRWVIGNAIYVIVIKDDIDSILPIVLNPENGISRQRFVLALGKIKSAKTEDILIKLLDDTEMALYAIQALERMKSRKAKEKISVLTNSKNESIRKEAQNFTKKMGL